LQSSREQSLVEADLASQIQVRPQRIQQLETDMAQLRDMNTGNTIINEDKQVHQLQERLTRMTAARDHLAQLHNKAVHDATASVTALDSAQLRVTELTETNDGHSRQHAELQLHANALAQDCKTLRETKGELTREIDTLKNANVDLTKQCDLHLATITDIRTAKDDIKDAISTGYASLQVKVRELERDNADLQASAAAQGTQANTNAASQARIDTLQIHLDSVNRDQKAQAAENRRLQTRNKELETANSDLTSAATHLKEVHQSDLSSQRDAQATADNR